MNSTRSLLAAFLILTTFTSCEKCKIITDYSFYKKYVTIEEGVWGSCTLREGNWQPSIEKGDATSCEVMRTIYFFEPVEFGQAEYEDVSSYSEIHTTLITTTESNKKGFYQVELEPGNYSVFIKEKGSYYCNFGDGQGIMGSVTVDSNSTTPLHLIIDYAVY